MSILFCTPMFANQCWAPYFESCLRLKDALHDLGMRHDFLLTKGDSLIVRARETSVAAFMKTDYERLMFIDADIQFHPDDVAKLWNLNADVAVGGYPWKDAGKNTVSAWKDGAEVRLSEHDQPFPVDYAGTGFMMIKRRTLEVIRADCYAYDEGGTECFGCFDLLYLERKGRLGVKLSEDYAFCERVRKREMTVWCDPSIRLAHWGVHGFMNTHDTSARFIEGNEHGY